MRSGSHQARGFRLRPAVIRLLLMGAAGVWSLLGLWGRWAPFDPVALVATLLGGYPIYRETFDALRHKRITMEVSMTVAIVASLLVRAFTAAVIIAFFVILAEFLESYAVDRARASLLRLEREAPRKARVRRDVAELEVDPQALVPGDLVLVRDGDRIPVDGLVVRGSATVNEASITGEAAPVEKGACGAYSRFRPVSYGRRLAAVVRGLRFPST